MIPEFPLTLVFLIAPAFLTVWVSREFSRNPSGNQLDANTLAFQALAIAALVLGLELAALGTVTAVRDDWRIWGGLNARQFFSPDPWRHVRTNPGNVVWVAAFEYLAHLVLFIILGLVNPIGRFLGARLQDNDLHVEDPFIVGIEGARVALGSDVTFALLRLTNGMTYSGSVRVASFKPRADGTRDLFLQDVVRLATDGTWDPVGDNGGAAGLLVSTRDIVAIELSYPPAIETSDTTTDSTR